MDVFYPPDYCAMIPFIRPCLPRCEGEFHVDSVVGAPLAGFRTGGRGKGLHAQLEETPASGIQVRSPAVVIHHRRIILPGDGGGKISATTLLRVSSGRFIHENWRTQITKFLATGRRGMYHHRQSRCWLRNSSSIRDQTAASVFASVVYLVSIPKSFGSQSQAK